MGAYPARDLPQRLDILQIYRGVAATLVVLYHMTWWGGPDPPFLQLLLSWVPVPDGWRVPGFFMFGHSGVDLFFTLSGFVMVWGYGRDAGNVRRTWSFVKARFVRIYPTYWAVFAVTVAYILLTPRVNDSALDAEALLRGFFLYGNGPWQVPPSGTLPFELALYFFFALLLLAGWVVFGLAAVLWCSLIVGQWYKWLSVGNYPTLLSPYMLEFFLGCLGAVFIQKVRPWLSASWLWVTAGLCLVIGVLDSVEVGNGVYHNFRNFAVPYLLLIVVGVSYELGGTRHFSRLLLLLGKASYSIYLTHYYLIWEFNGRIQHYPGIAQSIGKDGQRIVVCAAVLACGVAWWAAIEQPLLRLFRRLLLNHGRT